MRQIYVLLFIVCFYSFSFANECELALAPTATISGGATVCQNASSPVITFTGAGGTAPYTFGYKINGGATLFVSTTSGNNVNVTVPTGTVGTFTYTLVSVSDNQPPNNPITVSGSAIVIVSSPPIVDFTFNNDNTCSGTNIQFSSNITGGGSYIYSWDFGDSTTLSTQANPIHTFTSLGCGSATFNVTLTVTSGGCSVSRTRTITVKQKPDISFGDVNFPFDPFSNCSNASSNPVYSITVGNESISTCITSYSINWGDGNTQNNVSFPISHTYPQTGVYNMIISATGNNGCINSRNYIIKNVSNPIGGLNSPGSTQNLCAPTANLQFSISDWGTNSLDTTYTVNYGDGSPLLLITQVELEGSSFYNASNPANSSNYPIPHIYTASSCPANSFIVSLDITNACGTTPFTLGNISIIIKPEADFTAPPIGCVNTSILFTNTTISGFGQNCNQNAIYTWNFGDGTPTITTPITSPQNISHTYTAPGTYTVTMTSQNFCGISTKTQQICIEPPLTPQFTLNTDSGCTPLAVTATNNTVLTNQCSTPTYLWTVTYAAANCGTTITPIPNQTTANASYNFTEPGIYTITLTTTNSCGSTTLSKTVTVKKPPTVSIGAISNSCGTATINPVATVNSCAPASSTLTYAWSFPGGTPATATTANPGTISYSTVGTYTVSLVVTNECGASTTATQNFIVSLAPTITNTELSQTICSGNSTTLVTLTANPAGTTFTWTAAATAGISGFTATGTNTIPIQTITTTNSNPGTVTYTIVPTFNGCVGSSINYVVNVNPSPTITTQPSSSTVCLNGSPMPLVVALNSTADTPTYQWYSNTVNSTVSGTLISGATNDTFTPPSDTVGTIYYYCIISLSSGGCSGLTSNIATVTINPLPTITVQPLVTQNSCVGVTIQTPFSVSYSGGQGTPTYQWFSNTVNSSSGGTAISGATNATYSPPAFTTSGNYFYYVIISLNGNGCGTVTSTVAEVIVFDDPIITSQPMVSQILCQGATAQTLEVTASGGNGSFTYQWYSNVNNNTSTGTIITGATNATYIPSTTAVGTTYYYCIVSQTTPGCSVTSATAAITVNLSPSIVNQPQSSTVCLGGTPSTLEISFSNGAGTVSYQWYSNTTNDITTGVAIPGETNSTFVPPANAVGTLYYYCLVSFSGITGSCATISTNTASVTVITGATIDQQPTSTQNLCIGVTITNPLSISYTGGTGTPSYQWYFNTSNSNTGGTLISGATNSTFTPPVFTTSGIYYYYATVNFSGSGCGAVTSDIAEIIVVNDPIVTIQPIPSQTLCQNAAANSLTISTTGGVGNSYNYQWYESTTNSTTSGTAITGATSDTFVPPTATAGTLYYYCIVTQPNDTGCNVSSEVAMVTINLSPTIDIQPQPSTICIGESTPELNFTFINGSGTPNYQWYSNTINSTSGGSIISGATNATYNPPVTAVGTVFYYCEVIFPTLTGGCEIITTNATEITINQVPIINDEITTICSGTSFLVSPTNSGGNLIPTGTTYVWSLPTVNPTGAITGASDAISPQNEISQTLINITSNVATVTYTVTPTSGICTGATFTITVTVNPSINPNTIITNSTCFGIDNASISTSITGGIPFPSGNPYLINWSGPNGFTSTAPTIINLQPGTYFLTVDDAGGCPFSDSYIITEPDDIQIIIDSENDITCFNSANGSINISAIGGTGSYFYTWTYNESPYGTSEDISGLSPGSYVVNVTDINNCGPKTATFIITEPPPLEVNLVSQINVECFGDTTGSIQVVATGGTVATNYNFLWSGPNGFTSTTQNLANLSAGVYELTVTDDNNCAAVLSVTLTQSPEIIISYNTTPISCYGANDATLTVTLSGGIAPLQFNWNNLSTSLNQINLSAGDYVITVTDALGCERIQTINIPEALVFTVNPIVNNVSCFGANDGSINLNLTGGIAPVSLQWSDGSTAGLIRNNLPPGTYSATISDGTPCFITRTFTIIEPQALVLSANLTHPLDCLNAANGEINLIVSGGTPPFTYQWSNGITTEDLNSLVAGNYSITVRDANGCEISGQYILTRPNPLVINIETQTDANCETRDVIQYYIAEASGGVPPYTYQWSSGIISGAQNQIMQTSTNGMVSLIVSDALGCTTDYTVNVENPVIGTPSIETESFGFLTYGIYSINDPIQFFSNATGDYENIIWDFGDGTFSNEANPIHTYSLEKEYTVTLTVTYPFGCVYTLTISLLIEKGYLLVIPSAFTPNSDGINDTFRPVSKRLKNIKMDVYDSWGSIIYSETGDVLTGWNGKINDINAENGNYYSMITAETFYGLLIQEKQTFVLIK